MAKRILAEAGPFDRYLTGDAARALQVTKEGVRHLVRNEQLTCRRTPAGYRMFREDEVLRLAYSRNQQRLRGCRRLRPKKQNVRGEPRQLSFFGPLRVEQRARAEGPRALQQSSRSRGIAQRKRRVR